MAVRSRAPIPPLMDCVRLPRMSDCRPRRPPFRRRARLIGSTRVSHGRQTRHPGRSRARRRGRALGAGRGGRRSRGSAAGRLGIAALVVLLALFVTGLLAATIAPYPAGDEFLEFINKPQPPFSTPHHLLGTDVIGHDFLTQLLFGLRESVFSSLVCALGATLIGAVVGALAGYYGGVLDAFVTWLTGAVVSRARRRVPARHRHLPLAGDAVRVRALADDLSLDGRRARHARQRRRAARARVRRGRARRGRIGAADHPAPPAAERERPADRRGHGAHRAVDRHRRDRDVPRPRHGAGREAVARHARRRRGPRHGRDVSAAAPCNSPWWIYVFPGVAARAACSSASTSSATRSTRSSTRRATAPDGRLPRPPPAARGRHASSRCRSSRSCGFGLVARPVVSARARPGPDAAALVQAHYHLTDPILERYWLWVKGFAHHGFG